MGTSLDVAWPPWVCANFYPFLCNLVAHVLTDFSARPGLIGRVVWSTSPGPRQSCYKGQPHQQDERSLGREAARGGPDSSRARHSNRGPKG